MIACEASGVGRHSVVSSLEGVPTQGRDRGVIAMIEVGSRSCFPLALTVALLYLCPRVVCHHAVVILDLCPRVVIVSPWRPCAGVPWAAARGWHMLCHWCLQSIFLMFRCLSSYRPNLVLVGLPRDLFRPRQWKHTS